MFVTLVHCHVKPEHADAFADACRANHEASTPSPATSASTSCAWSRPDPLRAVRVVRGRGGREAHKDTPHYAAWRETVADWFVEPRYGVRYEGLYPEMPAS